MAQLDAIAAALQAAGPMVAAGFGKPKSRYQDQIDYGNSLMKTGASTAPVSGWVEGIARALQGPLGGYFRSEASDEQQASDAAQRDELTSAFATQDFEKVAKALANIPGQEGAAATLMLGRLSQGNQDRRDGRIRDAYDPQGRPPASDPAVAGAYGGNPPGSYNDTTSRRESGNDPRALNPQSGAAGLYQFMPQTWASARAAIPGLPADPRDATPEQQTAATNWLTETNRGVLRTQLGREPTQGELGLAHAVGAAGARAYMSLPPDTPIEALPQDFWQRLGEQYTHATYLAQNPQVRGKTVGQIIGEFRNQYERQPVSGAPPLPTATPIQYAPNQSRPMSPADIEQNGWQPIPQSGPDQGTWGPQAAPVAPPQAMPRPGSVPQRPLPPAPVAPPPATVSPPQAPAVGQEAYGAGAPPGRDPRPSMPTAPGFGNQPARPQDAAAYMRNRANALMQAGDREGAFAAFKKADEIAVQSMTDANKRIFAPPDRQYNDQGFVVLPPGVPQAIEEEGAAKTRGAGMYATDMQGALPVQINEINKKLDAMPGGEKIRAFEQATRDLMLTSRRYEELLRENNGVSFRAFMNDTADPKAQKLLMAYKALEIAARNESFINTGVLQPAETTMLQGFLLSPETLRGLRLTPEAAAAKFTELRDMLERRRYATFDTLGFKPPPFDLRAIEAVRSERMPGAAGGAPAGAPRERVWNPQTRRIE